MHPISLLYIEDDEDIRMIYSEYLKQYSIDIYYAKDGEEGYKRYFELKPNILLLDISMPKMDGLTLAKKVREKDKKVKIIITSSYGDQQKLLQAVELYLIKYLLKPIDPHALDEALSKAIEEINEEKKEDNSLFVLDKDTVWNTKEKKILKNGKEIKLTKNERRLLSLLSSDKNRVFTFFEIFDYITHDNYDKEYDANQIRALVKLVRKKVPKDAIINVYGEGYRFNPLSQ